MKQYSDLLIDILTNGEERSDRTGVGTKSVFGRHLRFDLRESFPAITTKKLAWKACVGELLWFIEGSNDERRLAEITHGSREGPVTIWTPNALAPYWKHKATFLGDLGRVYGVQWRHFNKYTEVKDYGSAHGGGERLAVNKTEVDQLINLVNGLKTNPYDRRHILSAWNPGELDQMALPPCHVLAQFYVSKNKQLSCHMYQRSVDVFLGLPFNIASYALLTHMLAQVCDYEVGELIISTGDTHLYLNHLDQVKEQLTRTPLRQPVLWLKPNIKDITKFTINDVKLVGYESHGPLTAPMAV
jgi:thymidylate synthase